VGGAAPLDRQPGVGKDLLLDGEAFLRVETEQHLGGGDLIGAQS